MILLSGSIRPNRSDGGSFRIAANIAGQTMPVRRGRTKRAGRLEFEIRELIVAGMVLTERGR
jgi:hypothetical protein